MKAKIMLGFLAEKKKKLNYTYPQIDVEKLNKMDVHNVRLGFEVTSIHKAKQFCLKIPQKQRETKHFYLKLIPILSYLQTNQSEA